MDTERRNGGLFVGREREMAELRAVLDDAIDGHGRIVMLAGEPGIGKTRIAQELASHAEALGAQTFWGWCHEQEGAPPYWPWVQPIRSYIKRTDAELLGAQMGPGAADICEVIPEVHEKLPDLAPPPALEPEQARFRLFDSMATFLRNVAQSQSLVLVLDDLQWADQPSLLLLEFLARQMIESRMMLVGIYRDVEVTRTHPLANTLARLALSKSYHREALGGLEREHVGRFIRDVSGAEPSQQLVQAIYGHTEGNPFFMTEVIRLLGERRHTTFEPEADGLEGLEIPQSVLEVIGKRLDQLSVKCVGVLTTAAVIGRQFNFRLLGGLSEEFSETQLLELVDEGLDAYLIQEVPGQGDVYQFSHALVQQTLRERLSTSRRVRLHAKVGQTLETLYGDQLGDHAAELAHHFSEASSLLGPGKLVKYATLAGERALAAYAHEEASIHFQQGLAGKKIPPTGSEPVEDSETAALLFGLGRAQAATLQRREAAANFIRAFEYYVEIGDVPRAIEIAEYPFAPGFGRVRVTRLIARALELVDPDSHQAGRLLSRYGHALSREMGDSQGAQAAVEGAMAIAQRQGDWSLEAQTLVRASEIDVMDLRPDAASKKCQRAIELAHRAGDILAETNARIYAWGTAGMVGDFSTAQVHAEAGLALAEQARDRSLLTTSLWNSETMVRGSGDWLAARGFSDRGLALAPTDPRFLSTRALLEFELGNFEEGNQYLDRLLQAMYSTAPGPTFEYLMPATVIPLAAYINGTVGQLDIAEKAAEAVTSAPSAPRLLVYWARNGLGMAAALRGNTQLAQEQYDFLKPYQEFGTPHIHTARVLGVLASALDRHQDATGHFEYALARMRINTYSTELAWIRCDYADTLLKRNYNEGDRAKAMALLDESLAISSELGMRPLAERVTALQERAESLPIQAPAYPDGLTQREVEVLLHLSQGKTNREIARELVLSERTVQRHIANIYAKINVRNRAEATTFALSELAPSTQTFPTT